MHGGSLDGNISAVQGSDVARVHHHINASLQNNTVVQTLSPVDHNIILGREINNSANNPAVMDQANIRWSHDLVALGKVRVVIEIWWKFGRHIDLVERDLVLIERSPLRGSFFLDDRLPAFVMASDIVCQAG